MGTLKATADAVLNKAVSGAQNVPGVVAMATNRSANIYEGHAGVRALGNSQPMTADTVMCIFSCTKAVTGAAAMQLVEEGKIKLSDPAKAYVPVIANIKVLDGFDSHGAPKLRAPKGDITVEHLLTHTAGFGYDFFNPDVLKYNRATNTPGIISSSKDALTKSVLLFDPGQEWEYGTNIDWVGQVVEAVRGKKLGAVMQQHIFDPLGMADTAFKITPAMQSRLAKLHQRGTDGKLTPLDLILPQEPGFEAGGHGLYATIGDYMKFIRMYLNDGMGPNGRVLKAETVAISAQNHIGKLRVKSLPGAIPSLSNEAEFFPGMPKTWGLSFMINDEVAPTGRPAGALAWAGLANLYYWIDRQNGLGGMWGTQLFPFADHVSAPAYMDFETAVYQHAH